VLHSPVVSVTDNNIADGNVRFYTGYPRKLTSNCHMQFPTMQIWMHASPIRAINLSTVIILIKSTQTLNVLMAKYVLNLIYLYFALDKKTCDNIQIC